MIHHCLKLHQQLRQLRRAFITTQAAFDATYARLDERQTQQFKTEVQRNEKTSPQGGQDDE